MKTTEQQQLLLFSEDEIEINEVPKQLTNRDLIREIKSLLVEVEIATDQLFDEEYHRAIKTLEDLVERIENTLKEAGQL
jgi:tetrahydromethanopterin S-methyltransferase subunit G